MELGKQIKMYRLENKLSQEELADRIYVSRQTISNWENDKSYPDINSLVLLSEVFRVSLDKLIQGDIEAMKDVIKKEEVDKMNRYGKVYTIMLIVTVVSVVPLFMWLGFWRLFHGESFGWFLCILRLRVNYLWLKPQACRLFIRELQLT